MPGGHVNAPTFHATLQNSVHYEDTNNLSTSSIPTLGLLTCPSIAPAKTVSWSVKDQMARLVSRPGSHARECKLHCSGSASREFRIAPRLLKLHPRGAAALRVAHEEVEMVSPRVQQVDW